MFNLYLVENSICGFSVWNYRSVFSCSVINHSPDGVMWSVKICTSILLRWAICFAVWELNFCLTLTVYGGRSPPLEVQPSFGRFFSKVNDAWIDGYKRVWSSGGQLLKPHLSDVVVVSIAGGVRDYQVCDGLLLESMYSCVSFPFPIELLLWS